MDHDLEWDDARISRLWNYYSRTRGNSESYFSKAFGDRVLRLSGLSLGEELSILDFGCGPGHLWDHLVKLGARWSYTGLDFSVESVDQLKQRAEGHPQFRDAIHVAALPSSVSSDSMDVVLLIEVVEHLKDNSLDAALVEARRVLKPDGVLVISTPNEEDLSLGMRYCPECGAIFHEWQHVRSWSAASLAANLQKQGLELRWARQLDFSAQGVLHRLLRRVRRWVTGYPGRPPHLLAVFRKTRL